MKFQPMYENGRSVLRGPRSVIALANREDSRWSRRRWLFSFGPFGTHVLVWGNELDDALEVATGWLAKHAPGFLIPEDSAEIVERREEVAKSHGLAWPPPPHADLGDYWALDVEALSDLTYTESGYILSYEWMVSEVSRQDIAACLG